MDKKEFLRNLDCYSNMNYVDNGENVVVVNNKFKTKTKYTNEAIKENELPALLTAAIQGKDVDHITRITGYYGRISSWNKGKLGELKDRHRSNIE